MVKAMALWVVLMCVVLGLLVVWPSLRDMSSSARYANDGPPCISPRLYTCLRDGGDASSSYNSLALSGGGYRSFAASLGFFSGLMKAKHLDFPGVIQSIETVSANSGGAWFAGLSAYSRPFNRRILDRLRHEPAASVFEGALGVGLQRSWVDYYSSSIVGGVAAVNFPMQETMGYLPYWNLPWLEVVRNFLLADAGLEKTVMGTPLAWVGERTIAIQSSIVSNGFVRSPARRLVEYRLLSEDPFVPALFCSRSDVPLTAGLDHRVSYSSDPSNVVPLPCLGRDTTKMSVLGALAASSFVLGALTSDAVLRDLDVGRVQEHWLRHQIREGVRGGGLAFDLEAGGAGSRAKISEGEVADPVEVGTVTCCDGGFGFDSSGIASALRTFQLTKRENGTGCRLLCLYSLDASLDLDRGEAGEVTTGDLSGIFGLSARKGHLEHVQHSTSCQNSLGVIRPNFNIFHRSGAVPSCEEPPCRWIQLKGGACSIKLLRYRGLRTLANRGLGVEAGTQVELDLVVLRSSVPLIPNGSDWLSKCCASIEAFERAGAMLTDELRL